MIEEIYLKNFKCFSEQSIPFANLNVLTGINGSGKSSLIQTLLMIIQSENESFIEFNGALIELGDYGDVQFEDSLDESIMIQVSGTNGRCSWGYGESLPETFQSDRLPVLESDTAILEFLKSNSIYVSAERWGPRPNVPLNSYNANPFWLGKHGEFTIQLLHALDDGSLRNALGTKGLVLSDDDPRRYSDDTGEVILTNIIAWMGEISPNVQVGATVIKDAMIGYSSFSFNNNNRRYRATNVGFGLSYSLSVVTSLVTARKGSIVIIENPEAHLHPKGQSKLGQLIAATSLAGVQVLVETHSEHVINGARIQVRKELLPPEDLNIMYVERDSSTNKSAIKFLKTNKMGQLSEWPEGFFDQQAKDMKTLITGD